MRTIHTNKYSIHEREAQTYRQPLVLYPVCTADKLVPSQNRVHRCDRVLKNVPIRESQPLEH